MKNKMQNKKLQQPSRRDFFRAFAQVAGVSVLAPFVLPRMVSAEQRRGAKSAAGAAASDNKLSWPVSEPGKGNSLNIRYYHLHADAEKDAQATKVEKNGTAWKDQFCRNCNFYKPVGKKKIKIGGKEVEKEVGTCDLLQKELVHVDGISNSWAKKI